MYCIVSLISPSGQQDTLSLLPEQLLWSLNYLTWPSVDALRFKCLEQLLSSQTRKVVTIFVFTCFKNKGDLWSSRDKWSIFDDNKPSF